MKTNVVLSVLGSSFLLFCIGCRIGGNGEIDTINWISFVIIAVVCVLIISRYRKIFIRIVRPYFTRADKMLNNILHTYLRP